MLHEKEIFLSSINIKSEFAVISYLFHNPLFIFDIDTIISASNFQNKYSKIFYSSIKEITSSSGDFKSSKKIDSILLEKHISENYKKIYESDKNMMSKVIKSLEQSSPSEEKLVLKYINIILSESYRSDLKNKLNTVSRELEDVSNASQMIEKVEKDIYDFTSGLFVGSDVITIGDDYEDFINETAERAMNGEIETGISTGLDFYDKAIGGGLRRGTVNVIAARPKRHKSFLALSIANSVSKNNIPVLYLDTELSKELQMARLTSIETKVPLHYVETGKFIGHQEYSSRVKELIGKIKGQPFDYVQIAGWSLEKQVSIIRRWFAKRVGKDASGRWNNALVILDYLKLMNAKDKGADKEYEALGYRISALHDLMRDYENPMLALAQQNRSGVDVEDSTTISGSDRIIWLCDNFSILSKKSDTELKQAVEHMRENPEYEDIFTNMKLNVVECRHGPGCQNGEFIGLYCDFKDFRKSSKECCGAIIEKGLERPIDDINTN